jgi:hypothetical protein
MNTWDIFLKMMLLFGKISIFDGRQKIKTNSKSVNVLGHENIFIEEGAKLEFVTLNASGPIYIGKMLKYGRFCNPWFALCEGAVVKMAAKIYGATR